VFYSFHYEADVVRVANIRNMGVVEGDQIASDNDWEQITRGGAPAIQRWIDDQMRGTSCCVVLIGQSTANRTWVNYEIAQAWRAGKGVVGVYIHGLKDFSGRQAIKGSNPLDYVRCTNGAPVSSVAKTYDPPYTDSKKVYAHIAQFLGAWIEEAIRIRGNG
jgi:hypothetical protein